MEPWLEVIGVCCGIGLVATSWLKFTGDDHLGFGDYVLRCVLWSFAGCCLLALVKVLKWMWGAA